MNFDPKQYPNLLEQFPHIIEKIKLFWGYPEFYQYIDKLSLQSRTESRQGFPLAVLQEIMRMESDHEKLVANPKTDWFYN